MTEKKMNTAELAENWYSQITRKDTLINGVMNKKPIHFR